jgi:hypothetical protein
MTSRNRTIFLALALVAGVLAGAAFAQGDLADKDIPTDAEPMTFAWTPPTTGTSPVRYEVQIRKGGPSSTDIESRVEPTNQTTFAVDWLTLYEVRVRAVDASNRVGPWSIWSQAEDRDHEEPSF